MGHIPHDAGRDIAQTLIAIRPASGVNLVIARAAKDRIRSVGTCIKHAPCGGRNAAIIIAGDDVIPRATFDQVITRTASIAIVVFCARQCTRGPSISAIRDIGIAACHDHVIPLAAVNVVTAAVACQGVFAAKSDEHVIACPAVDDIVAFRACHGLARIAQREGDTAHGPLFVKKRQRLF